VRARNQSLESDFPRAAHRKIDTSFAVADTATQFLRGDEATPATNTSGEQVIEAAVSGPDGANRLFTCTGVAEVQLSLGRHQDQITETWTFFVGPALSRGQFYRAIGYAQVSFQTMDILGAPAGFTVQVVSTEADWDDESERVEMRVEVLLDSSLVSLNVNQLRYWVTILAKV